MRAFIFFFSDFNITMSLIREKSTIAHEASDVDKIGAAKAIVRLWYTYKLDLAALFRYCRYFLTPPPIPLDGDSATIRNFGQNDTNHSRNGKSAVEAQ